MKPLEARVADALTSATITAAALLALAGQVDAAIITAEEAAAVERERAVDITISPDPVAAREAMERASFAVSRLRTVLPKLHARHQVVAAQEHARQWERDYLALLPERDALADEFRAFYPKVAAQLVDLLHRAAEIDAKASAIAGRAGSGELRRLRRVELCARDLENFSSTTPPIGDRLRLPIFGRGEQLLWPAAEPMPPAFYALPPHAGDEWHVQAAARGDAIREDYGRVVKFYDDQDEERAAREERERDKARPAA